MSTELIIKSLIPGDTTGPWVIELEFKGDPTEEDTAVFKMLSYLRYTTAVEPHDELVIQLGGINSQHRLNITPQDVLALRALRKLGLKAPEISEASLRDQFVPKNQLRNFLKQFPDSF